MFRRGFFPASKRRRRTRTWTPLCLNRMVHHLIVFNASFNTLTKHLSARYTNDLSQGGRQSLPNAAQLLARWSAIYGASEGASVWGRSRNNWQIERKHQEIETWRIPNDTLERVFKNFIQDWRSWMEQVFSEKSFYLKMLLFNKTYIHRSCMNSIFPSFYF